MPATRMFPCRAAPVVLGCTARITVPLPVPLVGVRTTQGRLVLAVQLQSWPCALTVIDPVPPAAGNWALSGLMLNPHTENSAMNAEVLPGAAVNAAPFSGSKIGPVVEPTRKTLPALSKSTP